MRTAFKAVNTAASAIAIASVLALAPLATAISGEMSVVDEGKKLAFDRKKGNCLACHMIAGGDLPGNIAPPLIAMKSRFPDKAKLRAQIYDASVANPHTMMPRFGPYGVLSDKEIDKVVEYIYTL
ncbi:MAG: sulfur oxidation c-type cytochrome SoxX [bacterium]